MTRVQGERDDAPPTSAIIDGAPTPFLGFDARGHVTHWNPAAETLLGWRSHDVLGRPGDEVCVPSGAASLATWLEPGLHPVATPHLTTAARVDGAQVPVQLVSWRGDGQELPHWTVCLQEAVPAAVQVEAQAALSLLEATLESTADGILVVDREGRVVSQNRIFRELWRIPDELLERSSDDELLAYVVDQLVDPTSFLDKVQELYDRPEASSTDVLFFRDGRVFGRYSQPQRVDGRVVGRVWSFRDLTAQYRLENDLRTQASTDPLTQLPNRMLFMERLEQAQADSRDGAGRVAVCLLDLDGFKYVNDEYGHVVGDNLLSTAAHRFLAAVRDTDTVARLGGDEFGVLLPDASEQTARLVAGRLVASFTEAVRLGEHRIDASVSVGYTLSDPLRPVTAEELLHQADLAMYGAKASGHGRVRAYGPEVRRMDRRALSSEVTQILADPGSMTIHLQPILALDSGQVIGHEALTRFPGFEFRSVAEWFAVAREVGKGPELEARALELALRWIPPAGTFVSVNVSPLGLADPQVQERLERDLRHVVVEVTEDAPFDSKRFETIVSAIRSRGGGIAVDDTGAGYDGLKRLVQLRPEVVKLDREFVHEVWSRPEKRALVEAMVGFCRRTSSLLCAEGLEDERERETLVRLGVPAGQGWLLGRPAPAAELRDVG